jgi:adenylate cyclase
LGLARAPVIQWSKLSQDDKLTLEAISWAFTEGLLDERTALLLAPIEVADIDTVLDLARKERAERMTEVAALLPQDLNDTNFEQGDESGSTEDTQAA